MSQAISCCIGILPAIAAMFIGGISDIMVIYSLLAGVVVSRFGLWTFDLAVGQLKQEWVDEMELGELKGKPG